MRFGAVLGTRDELDILPSALEHMREIGVELFWVLDGGSTDGSLEYLAQAEAAPPGDIWLWHSDPSIPYQHWYRLAAALARAAGIDWLLIGDSDEFWLPATGSLHSLIDLDSADVIAVPRFNVVLGPEGTTIPHSLGPDSYGEVFVHAQPIRRPREHLWRHPEVPWIQGAQDPKILIRPEALDTMTAGGHQAHVTGGQSRRHSIARDLLIAHLALRGIDRFVQKVANIRESVVDNPDFFADTRGWHWSRWAAAAEPDDARAEYEKQRLDGDAIAEGRGDHAVRSVKEIFEHLIPPYDTQRTYDNAVHRHQPWVMAAGHVCRLEGIELGGATPEALPENVSTGPIPEVLIPPEHLVRFYSSWSDGKDLLGDDLWLYQALSRDEELPVPKSIAQGVLAGDWEYLVLSLPSGFPMAGAVERLPARRLTALADFVGEFVRHLHGVDLPALDGETVLGPIGAKRSLGLGQVAERIAAQVTASGLLPDVLADQLGEWMSAQASIPSPDDVSLNHGSLDGDHVLGTHVAGVGVVASGVVGFDGATIASPMYELGPIWGRLFMGRLDLFWRFLDVASFPGRDRPGFASRALAWLLVNPGLDELQLPEVGDADTLDGLAIRWFGRPR